MIGTLKTWSNDLLQFFYPHLCAGCGNDLPNLNDSVCINCYTSLPETGFAPYSNNPVEKIFYGRLPVVAAMSSYYFTKQSALQNIIHALKYNGNQEAGLQLGKWMALHLLQSNRFNTIDYLIPMPLFPDKLKKRGFNQAAVLCRGISELTGIPVNEEWVVRKRYTDTQTKKGRNARWTNVEGSFEITSAESVNGKHLLLVDDVITTGATMEACGASVLQSTNIHLSIAALAWASDD
jgi:ComF family protein